MPSGVKLMERQHSRVPGSPLQAKRADTMTMELVKEAFKSNPSTRLVVAIDRSGKKLQVTLTLRRAS